MLTPRENLDVDSEDSEPAPHRNSGFRVVAENGLQLSQFLTRISNKRSSEIRVYSFQSRKPLPMTTKMGDLPLKMSIQIWSEDLDKSHRRRLESRHVKSADKDDAKDYKVFFIRHISSWEFFDSCETDRAQQDRRIQQLSNEVNSLRTELGAGSRHSMRELPHSLFFRPTPCGFRQVVQHVTKHVAFGIN